MTQPSSSVLPGVVFTLAQDLSALPEGLQLRYREWGALFAITGRHTVAQIGAQLGLSDAEREETFNRLLTAGLIVERELTHAEYLRATATIRDDEPVSLARFLRAGITFDEAQDAAVVEAPPPSPPPPAVPAEPSPTAERDVETSDVETARVFDRSKLAASDDPEMTSLLSLLDEPIEEATTRAIPTASLSSVFSFEPLPKAPPSSPSAELRPRLEGLPRAGDDEPSQVVRRLSLKTLMRHILERASDSSAGQLDIYRVFIRVDTQLLKRNGISTLRFEEDRLISDPELQLAITSSLRKTLGFPCPQDVFV